MRTNSIMSDPRLTEPVAPATPKEQVRPNDFERLANSEDYPQIAAYLDDRIKWFSQYAPNGTPVENLSESERITAWGQAMVVIREFEALKNTLAAFKRK